MSYQRFLVPRAAIENIKSICSELLLTYNNLQVIYTDNQLYNFIDTKIIF